MIIVLLVIKQEVFNDDIKFTLQYQSHIDSEKIQFIVIIKNILASVAL